MWTETIRASICMDGLYFRRASGFIFTTVLKSKSAINRVGSTPRFDSTWVCFSVLVLTREWASKLTPDFFVDLTTLSYARVSYEVIFMRGP